MSQKYRLGNQPEEYELKTDYLGWFPEGDKDWFENILDPFYEYKNKEINLLGPNEERVTLIMYQMLIKDAFHMKVFREKRFENWHSFCLVSLQDRLEEKFLIPLH